MNSANNNISVTFFLLWAQRWQTDLFMSMWEQPVSINTAHCIPSTSTSIMDSTISRSFWWKKLALTSYPLLHFPSSFSDLIDCTDSIAIAHFLQMWYLLSHSSMTQIVSCQVVLPTTPETCNFFLGNSLCSMIHHLGMVVATATSSYAEVSSFMIVLAGASIWSRAIAPNAGKCMKELLITWVGNPSMNVHARSHSRILLNNCNNLHNFFSKYLLYSFYFQAK